MKLILHSAIRVRYSSGCETDPEQTAYFVNWISSLPVLVVNRPDILNLTGAWRRASDWTVMAAVAGLQPAPFRSPTPPAAAAEGCVRLSHILNCDLIAAHSSVNRTGAWLITGFSPQPDLRLGGGALVDVIVGMMLASTTADAVSA